MIDRNSGEPQHFEKIIKSQNLRSQLRRRASDEYTAAKLIDEAVDSTPTRAQQIIKGWESLVICFNKMNKKLIYKNLYPSYQLIRAAKVRCYPSRKSNPC